MGIFSATGHADQVEHQRPHHQGRRPGEDALPGPRRHEEPARRGQEAGRGRDRRREAAQEAVGRAGRAGQGVGAQGDDGGARRRRRAGQGGARPPEGARGPRDQFEQQWHLQKEAVEKLKDQLRTLNNKIEEAKRKKNILVARAKRAEAQQTIQATMAGPVATRRRSTRSTAWPRRSSSSRPRPRRAPSWRAR